MEDVDTSYGGEDSCESETAYYMVRSGHRIIACSINGSPADFRRSLPSITVVLDSNEIGRSSVKVNPPTM